MTVYQQIKKYYKDLQRATSGGQELYYREICENLKKVACVPLQTVLGEDLYRKYRTAQHPQVQQCYANAAKLVDWLHWHKVTAYYVEGVFADTRIPLPIEHAFVGIKTEYGTLYVDPTVEIALRRDVTTTTYASFCEVDWCTLWEYQQASGVYGGVWREKFLEKFKKNLG